MPGASWADDRRDIAAAKGELLRQKRHAESLQAERYIKEFVADAMAAGVTPTRFTATGYSGDTRYRTSTSGWYLKHDRSVGVDAHGHFYVMTAATNALSRLTGVELTATPPPLELGKGGRDGESMPIRDALAKRLAGGNAWG